MPETTLYIPLQFWFCRNPGLALPLIALQYHEVKINLEFREAKQCYWSSTGSKYATETPSLKAASLYVDYIYLDTDERRRFAQVSHEYLIEQLQFTGDESVNSSSNKIKLNFNHPVKELVWVVQPDSNIGDHDTRNVGGPQHFNYTDTIDASYYTGLPGDPLGDGLVGSGVGSTRLGDATDGTWLEAISAATGTHGAGANGVGGFVYDSGKNPVVSAKLQLNGHDRFSERGGRYFNLVQPYQHHENIPSTGINVYSFGLTPEEHQPSGTCNMSRIDNATLHLTLTPESVAGNRSCKVRVYAVNYNVLRIMSGMGGLAYSN